MTSPDATQKNAVPSLDLARAYVAGLAAAKLRFLRRLSLVLVGASCALAVAALAVDGVALGAFLVAVAFITGSVSFAAFMILKAFTSIASKLLGKGDAALSSAQTAALDHLASLPTGGVGIVWYLMRLRRPAYLAAELDRLAAVLDVAAPTPQDLQPVAPERPSSNRAVSPVGSTSASSPAGSRTDGLAEIIGTLLFLVLIFGVCFLAMENGPYLSNWPGLLNFLVGALPMVGICFAAFETTKARERGDTFRCRAWMVVSVLFTALISAALGSTGVARSYTPEWMRLGTDADIRAANLRLLGLGLGLFVWVPLHIVVGVVRMEKRFGRKSGEDRERH